MGGRSGVRIPANSRYFSRFWIVLTGSGPTQPFIQWVPKPFHRGKAVTAIPLLPLVPSWRGRGKLFWENHEMKDEWKQISTRLIDNYKLRLSPESVIRRSCPSSKEHSYSQDWRCLCTESNMRHRTQTGANRSKVTPGRKCFRNRKAMTWTCISCSEKWI
jgi:hypothetical protein